MARSGPVGGSEDESGRYARLLSFLVDSGYDTVTPAVLQPIEPFLELSGEEIRRRIFVTQDNAGVELCLRPEFTIPVCRHHQANRPGQTIDYSYFGPVFRLTAGEPDEFVQTGIESIGRGDAPAADAEILATAVEGLKRLRESVEEPYVLLGDMALMTAFLDALGVPPVAKRRTLRTIASRRSLDEVTNDRYEGLLATIEGQDPKGVRALVEDLISIAGISHVGGRSAADIAERFLTKAAAQADGGRGLNAENRALVDRYCAIAGTPDDASASIRSLAKEAGLDHAGLEDALRLLDDRTGFMAARGLPVDRLTFSAGFARNLDYYSGFIFEIANGPERPVLVGGGRYDGLLERLGSPVPQPAVGCTFWLARCVE